MFWLWKAFSNFVTRFYDPVWYLCSVTWGWGTEVLIKLPCFFSFTCSLYKIRLPYPWAHGTEEYMQTDRARGLPYILVWAPFWSITSPLRVHRGSCQCLHQRKELGFLSPPTSAERWGRCLPLRWFWEDLKHPSWWSVADSQSQPLLLSFNWVFCTLRLFFFPAVSPS